MELLKLIWTLAMVVAGLGVAIAAVACAFGFYEPDPRTIAVGALLGLSNAFLPRSKAA